LLYAPHTRSQQSSQPLHPPWRGCYHHGPASRQTRIQTNDAANRKSSPGAWSLRRFPTPSSTRGPPEMALGADDMNEDMEFPEDLTDQFSAPQGQMASTQKALKRLSLLEAEDEYSRSPPAVETHSWDDPVMRASRWRHGDDSQILLHTLLKDLQLPSTRSKEVAKWRIKTAISNAVRNRGAFALSLPGQCPQELVSQISRSIECTLKDIFDHRLK
jgi:hypothetical protein